MDRIVLSLISIVVLSQVASVMAAGSMHTHGPINNIQPNSMRGISNPPLDNLGTGTFSGLDSIQSPSNTTFSPARVSSGNNVPTSSIQFSDFLNPTCGLEDSIFSWDNSGLAEFYCSSILNSSTSDHRAAGTTDQNICECLREKPSFTTGFDQGVDSRFYAESSEFQNRLQAGVIESATQARRGAAAQLSFITPNPDTISSRVERLASGSEIVIDRHIDRQTVINEASQGRPISVDEHEHHSEENHQRVRGEPITPEILTGSDTPGDNCISLADYLRYEMVPEKPLFKEGSADPGWNFEELKKKLSDLTRDVDYGSSDIAEGLGRNYPQFQVIESRMKFLVSNPLLRNLFLLPDGPSSQVGSVKNKVIEKLQSRFHSSKCQDCRLGRQADLHRDFFGDLGRILTENLDASLLQAVGSNVQQRANDLTRMVVLNDFRRSEMLRSAGLNEECSASTDDTCIEKWGNFCGRLSVRPSLPIDGLIGVSDYTVEFLNEIETSFELDRTKNKGYADFIENQCQNRRRGVPARNYLEFKNAYCLQNGCSSGPISHEKRREIFSAFLQQGPLDAETQGLVNFFKKTDLTMMSKAAATQVSYRSSIRDAFENFNVDLPNRPSAAGASTSASTSSSSQSGRSGDNSQSESSQAFQAMSSAFTPAASSNQVFSPFTTPLGREITSPEELENEVTTRRRALEQSDERISETRDERTRALQQGEQERILQLERQLARLEGERTSERRLLDQYESLLRQVQTPQGSIARQGGSDTNTSAQSENSDTRSSSLNRAPSNVSTFTPQPSLAPRSSETAEGDFATSAGSARLTAPGVDSRALASDPGGVLDTLRAGKYSGNEASLIVQNRDFTREQTLEVPVNSSEFARAQDGKFDFIVDNSTLRSFAAGKRLGEEFLLRLRTSSNDEVEVVVKVLEGGELKFVNSRHLSAQPALQEPNRSPASVNRLPILQGLFEGSP